ncbi:hypothetical protein J5N97_015911 [Dioscorea zingiberensis]|uniref:Uncharacterized protein n=1 Tax=Dioscorea zingiberensis TaxID=325984 RepID=A0A9D5CIN8_9LILI|nr:hypothetical protein J5N97_015911 [Dioscorea zingiberensis]
MLPSSETGVQEEWSGLSSQKVQLSTGNHSALLNDNGKQQSWNNHFVQNASSLGSRSFALFNEAEASPSCHTAPNFQPSSTRFSYEHNDQVLGNMPNESYHQSSKDIEAKHLDQSQHQKQFVEGGLQEKMQSDNSPTGAWVGCTYEQLVNTVHHSGVKLNPTSSNGVWAAQQNMTSSNVSGQPGDKHAGWSMDDPVAPSSNDGLAFHGALPQKFASNIPQSMIPSTSCGDTKLWTPQKADDQATKRGSSPAGSATCSGNSQEVLHGDPVTAAVSTNSFWEGWMAPSELEISRESKLRTQPMIHRHMYPFRRWHLPRTGTGAYADTPKPSDVRQQNFSLLQQMQAMRSADSGFWIEGLRGLMELMELELGLTQIDWKAAHMFTLGQNKVF